MTIPERIGRFNIDAAVGQGGMGIVYRGVDPQLGRATAIKLLAPHLGSDKKAIARFHREASLIASLKHPNIAAVYEYGDHEGRPYIALEWIEGRTLRDVLRQAGRLPLERTVAIAKQLASALDYAHQHGVIHRDLKPSNVLIGANDHATIVDFGIAFLDDGASLTVTGAILGTPLYMSPEQIQGQQVGARSDQYSLAVILYEALAGRPPFQGAPSPAIFQQQLFAEPPPITEFNPLLPMSVEMALARGLSKAPAARFETATDLQRALLALPTVMPTLAENTPIVINDQPIANRPKSQPPAPVKPSRWRWLRLALALAGGIFIGLLLPSLFSETPAAEAPALEEASQEEADEAEIPSDTPAEGEWGMVGLGPRHNNFVQDEWLGLRREERWWHSIEADGGQGLVGTRGLVVYSDGVWLRALNGQNSEIVWEMRLPGADLPLTVFDYGEDGGLFVPLPDGSLSAFQVDDRQLLWQLRPEDTGGIGPSGVMSDWEAVTWATWEDGLRFLNPYSAEIEATLAADPPAEPHLLPSYEANSLAWIDTEGVLHLYDSAAEQATWQQPLNSETAIAPLLAPEWGAVLVATEDEQIRAFSVLSGSQLWVQQLGGPIVGLAADWGDLFAVTSGGDLFSFDGRTGEQRWQLELPSSVSFPPIANGEHVMIATDDGAIVVVDWEGNMLDDRTIELGQAITAQPIIVGGWLYVRTAEAIVAFAPVAP